MHSFRCGTCQEEKAGKGAEWSCVCDPSETARAGPRAPAEREEAPSGMRAKRTTPTALPASAGAAGAEPGGLGTEAAAAWTPVGFSVRALPNPQAAPRAHIGVLPVSVGPGRSKPKLI